MRGTLTDATDVGYDCFSNTPVDEWVEDAACFSELGYWGIEYILNGCLFSSGKLLWPMASR